MDKKISIIMGIYNCAKTLPDAINSIITQTYTNWELIMCDDCSTDDTYRVAEEYKNKYPEKIILVKNDKNSKLAFSLNHCLKYATGEYVARMDGDDISLPDRFEKQVAFLKENPNVDLVGTAMQRFNETGKHDIVRPDEKVDKYTLRKHTPFCHATILTYKNVYDDLGGYTVLERTVRGQDVDLWYRFFAKNYKGANIGEPLYLVREDKNAVRRRTVKRRWYAYQTELIGHRLLNYPIWWSIKLTLRVILKSLVPFFMIDLYRKYQAKK